MVSQQLSLHLPGTCLFLFLLLGRGMGASVAYAGDARSQLAVDTQTIYPEMLRMARQGDWQRLSKTLGLLEPLIAETDQMLRTDLGAKIQEALKSRSPERMVGLLKKLIGGGVRALLIRSTRETDAEKLKQTVRQAFAEYMVIEPDLEQLDFRTSQMVTSEFRRAYVLARGQPEDYAATCQRLQDLLGIYL